MRILPPFSAVQHLPKPHSFSAMFWMKVGSDAFHKKEFLTASPLTLFYKQNTMNCEKAKQALATLQREKRAQQDRLQLAAEAKRKLELNK